MGAPADVCLAGLMHSVLGRARAGVPESDISQEELKALIGERACTIVSALKHGSAFDLATNGDHDIKSDVVLVELANEVEQATENGDLESVNDLLGRVESRSSKMIAAIETDVSDVVAKAPERQRSCSKAG